MPAVQVIGYGLPATGLVVTAVVVQSGLPVTSLVARVSPLTKPVMVASRAGLGVPYGRLWSFAVTVSSTAVTVSSPATKANV